MISKQRPMRQLLLEQSHTSRVKVHTWDNPVGVSLCMNVHNSALDNHPIVKISGQVMRTSLHLFYLKDPPGPLIPNNTVYPTCARHVSS